MGTAATYSVDTGELNLTSRQLSVLRVIAGGERIPSGSEQEVAQLRAARILDRRDRVHRSLQPFSEALGAAGSDWSVVVVEPARTFRYRVFATDDAIIGHAEHLGDDRPVEATPVLFTHRGRLGVIVLQLLDIPPRGRPLSTGPNGQSMRVDRLMDAVRGGPNRSPWAGEEVGRLWSVACSTDGITVMGIQTESDRLALGQALSEEEILVVGVGPEVVFERLVSSF